MTKKDEKIIVSIAESTIKEFVKDWSKTPYAWESEADVHAELYGRIGSALVRNRKKFSRQERDNYPFSKYRYKEWKQEEDFKGIYCKPKIKIKGKGPVQYPDIVIYKKTAKPVSVYSEKNESMLWVCEIKYLTEWSSQFSKLNIEEDTKKLKYWLEQRVKVYQLILERGKKPESAGGYIKCFENLGNDHKDFSEELEKRYKVPIHYHFIGYCPRKAFNEN